MAAYESALLAEYLPIGRTRNDGTIAALVVGFYRSAAFDNLKPKSKGLYRSVLDKLAQEDGHRLTRDMPRRVAVSIIEEIGEKKPAMANLTAKVMRRLFAYAVKKELRTDNPFSGIELYEIGTYHTWTEREIAAYESVWPIGTRERLAFDLLVYTGQRVGDVATMRRSDLRNGAIYVRQEKTDVELVIPLHPTLLRSIKECPAKGLTLIGSPHGRPLSANGLSQLVVRSARVARLPTKCVPHGLRKGAMRRRSTTKEIAAMSGHRTLKEVERYTAAADQERLARSAMARLPEEQKGT